FVSSRGRHTCFSRCWSSGVCSSDLYESSVQNIAAYVSQEMSLSPRLKTIFGVRMESFTQWHSGRDQAYAQAFEQALSSGGDLRRSEERRVGRGRRVGAGRTHPSGDK